ncbi:hypothetical protein NDU88_001677 [Pleurodeles waltl]|uniref:Uncharacterized protein n=1 Tax=Pleurodeles waltl TaxID=8319 RepID=A0AAV7NBT7_PLEWA|nr:hypothetical protein NDU88_001677 [Pleurodeles waltl]
MDLDLSNPELTLGAGTRGDPQSDKLSDAVSDAAASGSGSRLSSRVRCEPLLGVAAAAGRLVSFRPLYLSPPIKPEGQRASRGARVRPGYAGRVDWLVGWTCGRNPRRAETGRAPASRSASCRVEEERRRSGAGGGGLRGERKNKGGSQAQNGRRWRLERPETRTRVQEGSGSQPFAFGLRRHKRYYSYRDCRLAGLGGCWRRCYPRPRHCEEDWSSNGTVHWDSSARLVPGGLYLRGASLQLQQAVHSSWRRAPIRATSSAYSLVDPCRSGMTGCGLRGGEGPL